MESHIYRYALAPTTQFYFCGVPFRLDVTPKCAFNCAYCFAMSRGGRPTSLALRADPRQVARQVERAPLETSVVGEMLHRQVPVHFGGMSDPFASKMTTEISLEILRVLSRESYPVVISTKNPTALLNPNVIEVLENLPVAIQVSFSTLNEATARDLEVGAPRPKERLRALTELSKRGFYTIVRLQPLFPSILPEAVGEMVPAFKEVGVKHVTVEFIKLPVERHARKALEGVTNALIRKDMAFIEEHHIRIGREWLLPTRWRWENLQPLIEALHKYGLLYGAADYGLYHLGDTDECCGISKIPGFSNWYKGNFSYAIRQAPAGPIQFRDVLKFWMPRSSIRQYLNSKSRTQHAFAVSQYLQLKWNRPSTANAPDEYLGVVTKGERDEDGNLIYYKQVV